MNKRAAARDALPEFDALRDRAKAIKDHTIAHLDLYLEEYERKVTEAGGQVHWASTAKDANEIITWICREAAALSVTKGKSMVAEEIGLNDALEAAGLEVVETDLGEYIIQNRHEPPSHIIAPAVHLNKDQVIADFRAKHTHLPADRRSRAVRAGRRSALGPAREVPARRCRDHRARISWWRRPAPRSSSRTRATAT